MTRRLRQLLVICSVALLAACGGGNGDDVVIHNSDQTVVAGTVTGLGGVTVDGVTYGDNATTVAMDVDPRAETAATMADIKVGQQVEVQVDNNNQARKVLVRANVIGTIDSIDLTGSSFTAVGQTIRVVASGDGATMFEGVDGLAGLKVGVLAEGPGTLNSGGNFAAPGFKPNRGAGVGGGRPGGWVTNLNT